MRTTLFSWVSFLGLLCACSVFGQAAKDLTPTQAEYDKWATLSNGGVSASGIWVSYGLSYPQGADTLFVKNAHTSQTIVLPSHNAGTFIGDDHFMSLSYSGRFVLLGLKSGTRSQVDGISSFEMLSGTKDLMLISKKSDGLFSIELRKLDGSVRLRIDAVEEFRASPSQDAIAFCRKRPDGKSAEVVTVKNGHINVMAKAPSGLYTNFSWQKSGRTVVFVYKANEKASPESLSLYSLPVQKKTVLASTSLSSLNRKIDARFTDNLVISDDGERVLFTSVNDTPEVAKPKEIPQIWNTCDAQLASSRSGENYFHRYWLSWQPASGRILQLGNEAMTSLEILPGGKIALGYDDSRNKPLLLSENFRDVYAIDLCNGHSKLLVSRQSDSMDKFAIGPKGTFVAYYNSGAWFVADLANGKHTKIDAFETLPIDISFLDFVAWDKNEASILFSDGTGIWQIKPDGSDLKKITPDSGVKYRMVSRERVIALDSPLLLQGHTPDHQSSGYFVAETNRSFRTLLYADKRISELKLSENGKCFSYLEEDFDAPPTLRLNRAATVTTVLQSNPQYNQYKWGKSELVRYDGNNGKLTGVLCYPFNYDATKKYPMIVYIYESQNSRLKRFENPSLLNPSAFNTTYYTSRGYFVLFPDIDYVIGSPGFSAVNCVVNATKAALGKVPVDSAKVGLMGHSFGGYETNFVITQTNLFAAAISGAGVSDLANCYLTENVSGRNTNYWRFEDDQMRMGKTFFDDSQGYFDNSPITHAAKIDTPLLLYVGQHDFQVGVSQSMELHLALRRLQKENVLLIYPNQAHVFTSPNEQKDLTKKAGEWFDFYLKGSSKPDWVKEQ